jgi:hypothetical protein
VNNDRDENLRTEYAALSNHYNTIIGFRITLLGFYIATIALLVGDLCPIPLSRSLLGIFLTFGLGWFEMRSRDIFHNLARRGILIERNEWDFKGQGQDKEYEELRPHYSRLFPYLVKEIDDLHPILWT